MELYRICEKEVDTLIYTSNMMIITNMRKIKDNYSTLLKTEQLLNFDGFLLKYYSSLFIR